MRLPIFTAFQSTPDHFAFDDGESQVTYRQLIAELSSTKLPSDANLSHCNHIGWCPRNRLEDFFKFWLILKSNLVACPINGRFSISRVQEMMRQIEAKDFDLPARFEKNSQTSRFEIDEHAPATIILSSGSTGAPKPVIHSLAAHVVSATGSAKNLPLYPGDRWLWSLPLYHISGLSILIRSAVAGATVVGLKESEKLDSELLTGKQISHLSVVSVQLRRLLKQNGFPSPFLRYVLLGGSSIDPKLVSQARDRGIKVLTTYGLSEMASQVTTSTNTTDPATSGRILPGRELEISDETGEILVRGDTLCLGYFQNGRINPVTNGAGWFHTRDLGKWDGEQNLIVLGRMDNMFISGGENIFPENIERAMRGIFEIEEVFVVPKADSEFGHRPFAFVKGSLPDHWQDDLRQKLAGFEIPIQWHPLPDPNDGGIKVSRQELISLVDRLN